MLADYNFSPRGTPELDDPTQDINEMVPWITIVAPRGLPAPAREGLAKGLAGTLGDADVAAELRQAGLDVGYQPGAVYDARVAKELPLLRAYVHKAGITID